MLEGEQRRDFFTATMIAMTASTEQHPVTPEEVLHYRYPKLPSTRVEHDPDFGAQGSWKQLKSALKERTKKRKKGTDHASR